MVKMAVGEQDMSNLPVVFFGRRSYLLPTPGGIDNGRLPRLCTTNQVTVGL
jgi:hypothetical protein